MNTINLVELVAVEGGNAPVASWPPTTPSNWAIQLLLDQLAWQQREELNRWLLSLAE
jgi:hypothetical protein